MALCKATVTNFPIFWRAKGTKILTLILALHVSISTTALGSTSTGLGGCWQCQRCWHAYLWKLKRHLCAPKSFLNMSPGFSKLARGTWLTAVAPQLLKFVCPSTCPTPPSFLSCSKSFLSCQITPLKRKPQLVLCQTLLLGAFFSCREACHMTSIPLAAPAAALSVH